LSVFALTVFMFASVQDGPRRFTLHHDHAPVSVEVQATARCNDMRPIDIRFTSTRKGVSLQSPRFPQIGEIDQDLTEVRGALAEIGNLRDWKITCRGATPLLVFRGGDRADGRAIIVPLEISDGVVVGSPDPSTIRLLIGSN
jgi:hypothetical protein